MASLIQEERPAWPKHCAPPAEILAWLHTLRAQDGLTAKCLLGMRWLVLAELDRTAPEPPPKSITDFTPDEVNGFDRKPLSSEHSARYRH